jgi:hypothetical protein
VPSPAISWGERNILRFEYPNRQPNSPYSIY